MFQKTIKYCLVSFDNSRVSHFQPVGTGVHYFREDVVKRLCEGYIGPRYFLVSSHPPTNSVASDWDRFQNLGNLDAVNWVRSICVCFWGIRPMLFQVHNI